MYIDYSKMFFRNGVYYLKKKLKLFGLYKCKNVYNRSPSSCIVLYTRFNMINI